jgi:hypothetical protein
MSQTVFLNAYNTVEHRGGFFGPVCADIINLRFFDRSLALGLPSLFNFILIYTLHKSQHKRLTAIGQKKSFSHSLTIIRDFSTLILYRKVQMPRSVINRNIFALRIRNENGNNTCNPEPLLIPKRRRNTVVFNLAYF